MPSSQVPARPGVALRLGAALVLLPLAVLVLLVALDWPAGDGATEGDHALIELSVREAAAGRQWTGAYSRWGWDHPGPLWFYLMVPLYLATGGSSWGLALGAALLNLLCAAFLVAVALRRCGNGLGGWLALFVLALFFAAFQTYHPPLSLISIWNPVVAVLPLGALLALALLGSGGRWELYTAVALHAVVCQSHVSLVAVATVALLAVGAREIGVARDRMRQLVGPALAIVALWSLPLLDLLIGQRNLIDLARFLLAPPYEAIGLSRAIAEGSVAFSRPLWFPFVEQAPAWLAGLLSAVVVPFVISRFRSGGRHARAARLSLLLLVVAAVTLARGDAGNLSHTRWLPMLTTLLLLVSCAGLTGPRPRPVVRWIGMIVLSTLAVWQLLFVEPRLERIRETVETKHKRYEDVVAELGEEALGSEVLSTSGSMNRRFPGLVLALSKRGVAVTVDDSWEAQFGRAVAYGPTATLQVEELPLESQPLAGRQGLWLYLVR